MYPVLEAIQLEFPALKNEATERGFARLQALLDSHELPGLGFVLKNEVAIGLLSHLFTYSPFLSRILIQQPKLFLDWCMQGSDDAFEMLKNELTHLTFSSNQDIMKQLRDYKSKTALLIALADISGLWPLEKVTGTMSEFAELCTKAALDYLLLQAHAKEKMKLPSPDAPSHNCGFFVLAMGKLGARELNYSSDIDLILLFDREVALDCGVEDPQQFFPKMTRELATILQERTADGYVFRVDLRLRPDPASTPVALSTAGAVTYYETVGQNWERAALIKARPVAGDIEAGFSFLKQISPFIWRKHLDFAAIADIVSIKRQMNVRAGLSIDLAGHNLKTGIGGIREIEFFSQINQLIWGGRIVSLRRRDTCRTLDALAEAGRITHEIADRLQESYRIYRTIEHRLQMIDDQQTHTLPHTDEAREKLALFSGYESQAAFEDDMLAHLRMVHDVFSKSFASMSSLGDDEDGALSFTGVENDPDTVETIRRMGFSNAESVSEVIQGWHRGGRRATRTKRARELITELTPALLKALAQTTHPEQAFLNFDTFLTNLPAGVQLFSLFHANRHLLNYIAIIMGSAPAMAESLSKNPTLLDAILTADFFNAFPSQHDLFNELSSLLLMARDFEDEIEFVRSFKNEKHFQAGVQLLYHKVTTEEARNYLSDIADVCALSLLHRVEVDFSAKFPDVQLGELMIIALGRFGGRDLTFGSDLDLVFLYPTHDSADELKEISEYYAKLAKRYVSVLTAQSSQGKLYEVDTRLRPSGNDSTIALALSAFDKYFTESAWTFELMALTRARVLTRLPALQQDTLKVIHHHISVQRDPAKLATDIVDIRARVDKEYGSNNPWKLKHVRGGLMDLDFLAQYFILCHAHNTPGIIVPRAVDVFSFMKEHKLLEDKVATRLIEDYHFQHSLFTVIRLCGFNELDESHTVEGIKAMIAKQMGLQIFDEVKEKLTATLAEVSNFFERYITSNARVA